MDMPKAPPDNHYDEVGSEAIKADEDVEPLTTEAGVAAAAGSSMASSPSSS